MSADRFSDYLTQFAADRALMLEQLHRVVVGQSEVIEQVLAAIFTRGHCLLVGVPGLAKTLMVSSISQILSTTFKRIQFTPDLMPSDITGTTVLDELPDGKREFRFVRGPIFANVVLADEINRTPPKTQAALLEAMQERQVTAGQETYKLPDPFFVIATQNPIEQEGTYPLPEAQLDRFMFNIKVDYPSPEDERQIVALTAREERPELNKVLSGERIVAWQKLVRKVEVPAFVIDFIVKLVRATRPKDPTAPDVVKRCVDWGAGPRAGQFLVRAGQAFAAMDGRPSVAIDDVKKAAVPVLRHRVSANFQAQAEGKTSDDLVADLLKAVSETEPAKYVAQEEKLTPTFLLSGCPMMEPASHEFLKRLLETPSPSGYEQHIQQVVRDWTASFADEVRTDRHGNVFASRFPQGRPAAAPRIMLAGHCDQIGLMVQFIDPEGYLYIQPIGGWDMQILLGQYLTVWAKSGPITGVVARRAIHLLSPEDRTKVPQFTDVWVDVGAKNKVEVQELIRPGDAVTFALGYRPLRNSLAASPAMDDKVGLWVVMEALRLLHGRPVLAEVHGVSTVAEEIGLRGATTAAYAVNPTVGIAVDVCHATDTPGDDKKTQGEIKCGDGPVVFRGANISPRVFDLLEETAAKHEIPIQVRGTPRATGTDANAIQISREGCACGLIGIPNRYMHSPVEVVHLDDLSHAAKLLAEFCAAVGPETNWIP